MIYHNISLLNRIILREISAFKCVQGNPRPDLPTLSLRNLHLKHTQLLVFCQIKKTLFSPTGILFPPLFPCAVGTLIIAASHETL